MCIRQLGENNLDTPIYNFFFLDPFVFQFFSDPIAPFFQFFLGPPSVFLLNINQFSIERSQFLQPLSLGLHFILTLRFCTVTFWIFSGIPVYGQQWSHVTWSCYRPTRAIIMWLQIRYLYIVFICGCLKLRLGFILTAMLWNSCIKMYCNFLACIDFGLSWASNQRAFEEGCIFGVNL